MMIPAFPESGADPRGLWLLLRSMNLSSLIAKRLNGLFLPAGGLGMRLFLLCRHLYLLLMMRITLPRGVGFLSGF
ncbi:hypothetical protein [Paraburkholderia sp. GAS42]|jgi:hypothetical protein|uniref:hypothetical protein n=1 Tax=Paraburkholderia sp. GAS42 TaxID=3035135 RepID=UPI003D243F14